jgi:hypothetical protein
LDGSNVPLRDVNHRVYGGIRSAEYDAPRSVTVGQNSGKIFCVLAGYHQDFTPLQMCERYGSHQGYVNQVKAFASANMKNGFILPEELKKTVDEAEATTFSCSVSEGRALGGAVE